MLNKWLSKLINIWRILCFCFSEYTLPTIKNNFSNAHVKKTDGICEIFFGIIRLSLFVTLYLSKYIRTTFRLGEIFMDFRVFDSITVALFTANIFVKILQA